MTKEEDIKNAVECMRKGGVILILQIQFGESVVMLLILRL